MAFPVQPILFKLIKLNDLKEVCMYFHNEMNSFMKFKRTVGLIILVSWLSACSSE